MFVRRLVLAFSIFVTGSLSLAVAGTAAGGGMGPGSYTFNSKSATAFFGMGKGPKGSPSWSVIVSQGLNSFSNPGGQRVVMDSTVVEVTEFDAFGNGGFGCFVVPDSDFIVNRDLSASLHTTLTPAESCDAAPTPIDGGKGGPIGGGGEDGLPATMTIDITWSPAGAVDNYKNLFQFKCLNYNEDGNGNDDHVRASATGSISALDGLFVSDSADINSDFGHLNVHNVLPDAC